ncbi:protocadherin Fat 1-like isoform X1 [Zophobas morio]|uniref:protocadherin Fat 1-like isoform X1 n=1 Tax=Zophobas morio TaxID=2755281 RepID=UPI003082C3F3
MKQKITLFILSALLARCSSQANTKCDIDDPEGILDWNSAIIELYPVKDSDSLNVQFTYRGDLQVVADTEEEGAKYIDVTADGSTLSIKTNDYFRNNYEEDQKDQAPASTFVIYRTLSITCDGTTYPLNIQLYVQDTNNHAPTFTQDTYTYVMPMPLVPNIDLTNFGEVEIIAEDIDFSNTKLTFTVDPPEYFALDFKALPSRQYHAVLKVTQFVRYDKDLTLTITATDETDPFNTGTATVVIKKDNDFSQPDIPTFSELIYAFTYSNDGGNPAITPDDPSKEIVVTTSDSDQTEVSLSDETYFKAEYDKTTNIVAISVTNTPVESASESMMTLTLTVKLGSESSESAIIVKLPSNVVVIIPKFTAPYYTATYSVDGDGNPSLALDAGQEIAITQQASNLDVKLEGDDHFSIANVDGVWTLKADSPLQDEILKKGEDITLTLHATVTDENSEEHEGFGVVIVKLPPVLEVPRFVEANYRGQYKVDEAGVKDTVELTNGPINIVQTDETVDIVIVDNTGYFTLIKDTDGWTVDVLKYWEQVTEGGDIVLTLSATVTGADVEPGYSTLIIALPAAAEAPIFDKPYYTATYKTDTNPNTLEMTDIINVAGGDGTVVNFLDSETNSQFFNAVLNDDKSVTVSLKNNLDLKTILGEVDIVLTLQATDPAVTEVGTAALVVELPKEVTPAAFTQVYYTGSYDVDNDPDVVKINEAIELSGNYLDSTTVVLVTPTGLEDKFKLSVASPYTITLTGDIDDVHSYNEIVLTLEASIDGVPRKTSATVVIEVPSAIALPPKFSSPLYEFKYDSDSDTVTSTDGKTITIDASDPSLVLIRMEGPYTNYFNIIYEATGVCILEVANPLNPAIIDQNVEIFIVLNAVISDSSDTSSTIIAIKMPEKTGNVPLFSESYYKATYTPNESGPDIVTIPDVVPITIVSDQASDTVVKVIGQYEDNFQAEFNSNTKSWDITVINKLDDDILNVYTELVITLGAVLSGETGVGTAALILFLPDHVKEPVPLFEEASYNAQYDLREDGTPEVTGDLIVVKAADPKYVEVTLAGYTDNFILTPNENNSQWTISSSGKPLDDDTLKNNAHLVITLNAHLDNAVADGVAILVVTLPHD